jgi:hypothetical protein
MDLDEVGSNLLASFNGSDESIFDALHVVLSHRNWFCVICGEGDVTWTVNYSMGRVNGDLIVEQETIANHYSANHSHPQVPGAWGL